MDASLARSRRLGRGSNARPGFLASPATDRIGPRRFLRGVAPGWLVFLERSARDRIHAARAKELRELLSFEKPVTNIDSFNLALSEKDRYGTNEFLSRIITISRFYYEFFE